jgi:hypothetical protein
MILPFGSDASLSATGQVLDAVGTPVALQAGEATVVGATQPAPVPFFTNRNGRFVLQGLMPGRYQLRMNTTPPLVGTVEIRPTATLHMPLGAVQLGEE